jgi:hypothetical protein
MATYYLFVQSVLLSRALDFRYDPTHFRLTTPSLARMRLRPIRRRFIPNASLETIMANECEASKRKVTRELSINPRLGPRAALYPA